jgi:D-xylose transport system ATP-binding protein
MNKGAARLELRDVGKTFPGVRALDGVSFELRAGEIHALCGENGAGKSTLLKILAGIHPADSWTGEMRVDGAPVRLHGIRDGETHGIALIAQELALVPQLSVEANVMLGREPTRAGLIDANAMRDAANTALARVGLDLDPAQTVQALGIGQQQLVEIAKALHKTARILVLDEPTAALPEADVQRLLALLVELRSRGTAILYVSHRLDEVFQIADRITVLRDGRSVYTADHTPGDASPATRERVIAHMVGRAVSERHVRVAQAVPAGAAPLLSLRDWSLADPQRPWRPALHDISLDVHAGEVLGLAGLMGAGRTALLASLFGAARSPVSGRVRIGDAPERAPFASPAEALAAGVALVSEDRRRQGLVPEGSILDNISLATLARFAPRGVLRLREREVACRAQSEALQIRPPALEQIVMRLSGGNQQKVVLGRWLLAGPRVLLLDEPTRGIDVGARAEIYGWIERLSEQGLAIVLVSSDLPELLSLSDRVAVLCDGRLTATLAGDAATPEIVMAAATRTQVPAHAQEAHA